MRMKIFIVPSLIRGVLWQSWVAIFLPAVVCVSLDSAAADIPLYRAAYTYTTNYLRLEGFNNAGDVAALGYTSLPNLTTAYLLRGGVMFELTTTPVGVTNELLDLYASDISQTNGDGSVKVLGWIDQSGLIRRGIILNVSAAGGVTSSQLLPYYVEPTGSAYEGQTNVIGPIAMNSSGVVIGPRALAGC
jgi:hypothetical protein